MQTYISTTPFGQRPMSLGQISRQVATKSAPAGTHVDKWKVFQSIREAKDPLGATDRSLTLLNALLSFHRDDQLSSDGDLIVWPSNAALMARANGMPATTLRRHLAVLVECGLIIRRDSPNGKRFARKGRGGEIEQAYGFDLSPVVARADEFSALAETVKAEKKALRVAKERLTLLRRDIVKLIELGLEENVPGDWTAVRQTYQTIVGQLPRSAPRQLVEDACADLHRLCMEIREVLESFAKTQNPDANESHNGRHIQNSNPDFLSESENGSRKQTEAGGNVAETDNLRSLPKRELPLTIVMDACRNLLELAQGGNIRHWRDFVATAELARPMLGISPSAWREACEVMGDQHAAITLAAIYQRSDRINNAGGYLRSLTERAKDGKFSTWPMIMALLRERLDTGKSTNNPDRPGVSAAISEKSTFKVSASLLQSLKNPRFR